MIETSPKTEWLFCPKCGGKTRLRLREDTELIRFPLFCPKCRRESLITVKRFCVFETQENKKQGEPDAETQC